MKILFLCHRIPYPPNKGDKLRAFNIIRYLSEKHDVYLVSLFDDIRDIGHKAELEKYCAGVSLFYIHPLYSKIKAMLWLIGGKSMTLGYFYCQKAMKAVQSLVKDVRFDAIFVYSSSMAQYADSLQAKIRVIDFVDCDSAKWEQYSRCHRFPTSMIFSIEHKLLERYEKKEVSAFKNIIVTTEVEKERFGRFVSTDKFTVVKNGVDFEFFTPCDPASGRGLIFTGAMDYYANVDGVVFFCGKVLPLVRNSVPGVEMYIVGPRPTASVKALAGIPGVHVTGFVEDLRVYLRKAAVCVVPSFRVAEGIQNKILEAMASAVPVVTTSKAAAPLSARNGSDILIADTVEDFAEKVIKLLRDPELRRTIGANGRKYVTENHSWQSCLSILDGMF